MTTSKITYKYVKNKSIVYNLKNDYELSVSEFYLIYNFYVLHSILERGVYQHYTYEKYGWESENYSKNNLTKFLKPILDIENDKIYKFENDYDDISDAFKVLNLEDSSLDFSFERYVVGKISEGNHFEMILRLIRDSLVHGTYSLKLYNKEKMIIIQDQMSNNVTGRMIIKLDTLLNIIKLIDKNEILSTNNN